MSDKHYEASEGRVGENGSCEACHCHLNSILLNAMKNSLDLFHMIQRNPTSCSLEVVCEIKTLSESGVRLSCKA